jgi:competence protein ComEC
MIRWIPYTFIRTAAFFIAGILLGIFLPDVAPYNYALTILLTLLVIYFASFVFLTRHKKSTYTAGLIALPAVFIAGYVHVLNQTETRDSTHFSALNEKINCYKVNIINYAEEKERTWRITAAVTELKTGTTWHKMAGKVVLYFPKDKFRRPFNYGDILLINGAPNPVQAPSNPGEFDYRRFLSFRNIFHQHFIRGDQVILIDHSPQNMLIAYALKARLWANSILHHYISGSHERAVASALILGVTDGLDDELLGAYAASGAMHVLAVSGLHISIIYLIILAVFKPVAKAKNGNWIIACLSLVLLWAYAFITGLSPSVLRAVTMFTFIAVAKATSRNTNIYNTLAASAFCLLLFDPFLIMSVGFQLSYLAVIGILYIHPLLSQLWEPESWAANEIWKITSVSIAAQVATFSLGLLYFHQFPNYFLLANLLVIPLSFAVLVLGIALIFFSIIPFVAAIVAMLLELSIKILNTAVLAIEWLPFSVIEDIYITPFQTFLLMAFVVAIILMLRYKSFKYFRIAFLLMILFTGAQWSQTELTCRPHQLIVYKVNGHTAIDISNSGHTYFFADTGLIKQQKKIRFHIKPNRMQMRASNVSAGEDSQLSRQIPGGTLIGWCGQTIVQITNDIFTPTKIERVAVVIVSNNAVKDLGRISETYKHAVVVFDSSNSFYYVSKLLKQGQLLGLKTHSVLHEGAFQFVNRDNS